MISHDRAQELLSDRLDAPLALSDARALQEHLAACPSCRAMADAFGGLSAELRGLPSLPPSPAVSRAVLEHVHSRRPAWSWLRTGLGAAGSPAVAVASGLALTAALAGTIYLATSDRITTTDDGRTPVSAIAVSPDETPSPTPPPTTIAAPAEEPEPEPTATSTPPAIAFATATATPEPTRAVEAVVTPTPEPIAQPTEVPAAVPTEAPQVAMIDDPVAEPTVVVPTPEPAIRTAPDAAPTAAAVAGVIETAQQVEPADRGEDTAAIRVADEPVEPAPTEEPTIAMAAEEAPPEAAIASEPVEPTAEEAPEIAYDPAAVESEPAIEQPVEPIDPVDVAPVDEGVLDAGALFPEATQPPIEPVDDQDAGVVSDQPASSDLEPVPTIAPTQDPSIADEALEPGVDESGVPIQPATEPEPAPEVDAARAADAEPLPTEAPPAPPDGDIAAAAVIGAGDPGGNPIVSPNGAVLTTTASDDGSVTIAVPDASGAPVAIDPTDEPHTDTPVGWAGGSAYYQRAYPDGRLELRAGSPGGGGWVIWSGAPGIFGPGIGQARLTAGGDRIAFLSGGTLYIAPTGDPNAAAALAVGNVVGFDWAPGGDRLAVSDGYAISIFGPYGEGPLISVGNQGGIPIGTVDWREDGIAVARYDTGEMVLIPI